jgi:ABC-type transport system involved in multi-copper enzyme maturation permease subunit
MNTTLFLFTLKSSRGSIIVWSFFLFLYAMLMVYLFNQMQDIADTLAEYIEKMGSFIEIFAGDVGSILNPDGTLSLGKYMSLEFLSFWPLLMSVYAIFNAGGIAAREVERGTMDMLLSQPLSRRHVIMSKFLVFPLAIVAVAVACIIGILIYILHILARTVGPLKWLGNLSIFHYYEPAPIASELSMNWLGIGIYLGIMIICFTASLYVFQRRDITA